MPKINNETNSWITSPCIVILYYRPYSCGKFLSNILSFNENFVAQIPLTDKVKRYNNTIESIRNSIDDNLLLDYKIKQIFLTIHPTIEECKNWWEYELGCSMFWNFDDVNFNLDVVNPICLKLLENQKYCFIVAHTPASFDLLHNTFINATIIELINDSRVRQLSLNLKANRDVEKYKSSVLITKINSIKFDIDTIFDKQQFFQCIDELLNVFNLKNKILDNRVYDYYEQYINLYNAKTK